MRARFVPLIAASLTALAVTSNAATPTAVTPTFDKDVLPILQKNCQDCHRPGEVAPMSLLTYTDARPWAKAMKAAVVTEKMPPWFADPNYGHFANDRTLEPSRDRHPGLRGPTMERRRAMRKTRRHRSPFRTAGTSSPT